MSDSPAYDALYRHNRRNYRLQHATQMLQWDSATLMPPKGQEARAEAIAELEGLIRGFNADPQLTAWLQAAEQETLAPMQRANLRETRRAWQEAHAVPADLASRRGIAGMRCEHAWREQRHRQDWEGFLANFKPLVELVREEARYLADSRGLGRYDALLDLYEPGLRDAEVARLFGEVRQWLPGLIRDIGERQRDAAPIAPQGPFPEAVQFALAKDVMRGLGFDFDAGRLDLSSHPFCGGTFEDVRLTTRFNENELLSGLTAVIHETGHALYNMGLPVDWRDQPAGLPRWGSIHESQALLFEKQVGFSAAFATWLSPLLRRHYGDQPAFAPDNLVGLLQRVSPGFIRVNADEATYPAHVILRYEIERALLEGEIEAEDIPALWNAKMVELLGIDPGADYSRGCMQDMHWAMGLFGYFPGYLLGSMYAAQWFAAIRHEQPQIDDRIGQGCFDEVIGWLRRHVHCHASRYEAAELVVVASGESLNPDYFRQHLERRYLER